MKPIRAVFFDMDGTLFSFRTKRIPDSAYRALREANRRGLLLFIATGRHILALKQNPHLRGVDFSGYVAMNGQFCTVNDRVVSSVPLHPQDVAAMLDYLQDHPLECTFFESDFVYMARENREFQELQRTLGSPVPEVCNLERARTHSVYQICILTPDGRVPEVVQHLQYSTYTRWNVHGMDLIPKNGNKWKGVQQMLHHFGLSGDEVAAVGDGDNDFEMLEHAGLSIAMGNASDKLKQMADYVTGHVDENGLAQAMQMIFETRM